MQAPHAWKDLHPFMHRAGRECNRSRQGFCVNERGGFETPSRSCIESCKIGNRGWNRSSDNYQGFFLARLSHPDGVQLPWLRSQAGRWLCLSSSLSVFSAGQLSAQLDSHCRLPQREADGWDRLLGSQSGLNTPGLKGESVGHCAVPALSSP